MDMTKAKISEDEFVIENTLLMRNIELNVLPKVREDMFQGTIHAFRLLFGHSINICNAIIPTSMQ